MENMYSQLVAKYVTYSYTSNTIGISSGIQFMIGGGSGEHVQSVSS